MPLHDVTVQPAVRFHRALKIHTLTLLKRTKFGSTKRFGNDRKMHRVRFKLRHGETDTRNGDAGSDLDIIERGRTRENQGYLIPRKYCRRFFHNSRKHGENNDSIVPEN